MESINEFFERRHIDVTENDTQYILECPICHRDKKVYMGKANLAWDCKVCGAKGSFQKYKHAVEGDTPLGEEPAEVSSFSITETDIEEMQKTLLEKSTKLLSYLMKDRKFTLEVIKKAKLGANSKGDISIPHFENGNLIGLQYRQMNNKIKYMSEKGSKYGIFNESCLDTAEDVLICEGFFDGMAAQVYGFANVVAIPGASAGKTTWIHRFRKAKNIFIAYDCGEDEKEKGQKGAYSLAVKLGLERCKSVQLPYGDMNECLIQGVPQADIVKAVKEAKSFPVPGICTLDRFEDELIDHIFAKKGWSAYKTGYEQLDAITHGFDLQELRVVSGVTGAGKTTWIAFEMLRYAERGIPVAMFSLESPIKKVGKDLIQSRIDRPITDLTKEELIQEVREFKNLPMYYFDSREFNSVLNLHRFREALKHARDSYGIKFAVLDDMQFILNTGNRNLNTADKITETIAEMKLIANTLNIHLVIIAHINRENEGGMPTLRQLKGSSGYEQLADYAMFVHRETDPSAPPDIASAVSISISKNRIHGTLGQANFRYDVDKCVYLPE